MIYEVVKGDVILSHACQREKKYIPVTILSVEADTLMVMFEGRPTEISRWLTFMRRRSDFIPPASVSLVGHGKAESQGVSIAYLTAQTRHEPQEQQYAI